MKTVSFQAGEMVKGWIIKEGNHLGEYIAENKAYTMKFITHAGGGRNYFKVLAYEDKKTGRRYHGQRFLIKFTNDVREISSELFFRHLAENKGRN